MQHLEDFPSASDLYEYRRSDEGGVPLWLPHNQGDVFVDVEIPNAAGGLTPSTVMLFMHPCTMRRGAKLAEKATVIEVGLKSSKKALDDPSRWIKYYSAFPLPDFSGEGRDAYIADLTSIWTIPMNRLLRTKRVVALSSMGRSHMQHRTIFHLTRLAVPVSTLETATGRVQAELQLQGDWCQSAWTNHHLSNEQEISMVEAEFQKELDQEWVESSPDEPETLRQRLNSPVDEHHASAYRHLFELSVSGHPGSVLNR